MSSLRRSNREVRASVRHDHLRRQIRQTRQDGRVLSPEEFEAASLALFASGFRSRAVPAPAPVAPARPSRLGDVAPPMWAGSEWRDPMAFRLFGRPQHGSARALATV